ncbi:integration host factor subunit alpha [Devosia lucknowensis]|uniref:Integration host factor subunit alpha n=1 Tax=Devosia lucknowensis TaxID=1096929 RepID=A0A1Y6GA54_9HYPH|nr:HU family DNA-binding protein [Devosia lucknowensis]SMQ85598.1 integration host factor subunit alpha [Devosia lucknowensis]
MEHTITRAALSERAADATGLSRFDTAQISDRMFELIGDALKQGETVKLTGFGTLEVRSRAERVGRNPRTGDEHRIAPRHTVVLIPSARLRDSMDHRATEKA